MNVYSTNKIKELGAILLTDSREWKRSKTFKCLEGRQVYWSYKQKIFTIKYICPMTLTIWFTQNFNNWKSDTNALSELYLIPKIN